MAGLRQRQPRSEGCFILVPPREEGAFKGTFELDAGKTSVAEGGKGDFSMARGLYTDIV